MRVFGAAAYEVMMRRPLEFIIRAAEIQGQEDAARRVLYLHDTSFASGLKRGQEIIDPDAKPEDKGKGLIVSYTLLEDYITEVLKLAEPWNHTPEALTRKRLATMRRLSAEQDKRMREMFGKG